jgi:hypothetical protein
MPEAIFPAVIDNTIRSDFKACEHQWFRRHCQGLTPKSTLNLHLHFGGCFARGLEVTRKTYHAHGASEYSILTGARAALGAWGDYEMPDVPPPAAYKTPQALLDALFSYFVEYPLATDRIRPLNLGDGPIVETSFAVPIPGCYHPVSGEQLTYSGRFDMVGTIGSAVWVVDEKTSSQLGDRWRDKWSLDAQPTGYCWGLRQYGLSPVGAIIRGIGILGRDITFAESIQPRSPWQIDQWLHQLIADVERMTQCWYEYQDILSHEMPEWTLSDPEGAAFPRALDKDICHAYGHPCAFVPLCSSNTPEAWMDEYIVKHWDPLARKE